MKYEEIKCMPAINLTDSARVAEIESSIRENGWVGAPILVCNLGLVTGSHRQAALENIYADYDYEGNAFDVDVAEDVTDEISAYCEREGIGFDGIQFDSLGTVFAGTWVEDYKDQIVEW